MTKRRADFKSDLNLVIGREHANGHGQIEARPLLLDIRRRQIDRRAPHRKLEPGIGQRRRNPVSRLLHRRIREPGNHDEGVPPSGIDFHIDKAGLDAVDCGG